MITLKIKAEHSLIPTVVTLKQFPCRIGRSLKNTIILEDDSISKEHAIINFDHNGHYIMDLESTNGIFYNKKKCEKFYLTNEMAFKIGDLQCQVFFEEESPDKTRLINLSSYKLSRKKFYFSKQILLSLSILMSVLLIQKYVTSPLDKNVIGMYLLEAGISLVLTGFVAGLLSLISKIHVKQYRYPNFLYFLLKWLIILHLIFLFQKFCFSIYPNDDFWQIFFPLLNFGITVLFLFKLTQLFFTHLQYVKAISYCILVTLALFSPLLIKKIFIQSDSDRFSFYGYLSYPIRSFESDQYPSQNLTFKINEMIESVEALKKEQIKDLSNK